MATTAYPRAVPSYNTMLHLPSWNGSGQGLRPLVILHGHGGSALQAAQGSAFGTHPTALADAGFAVMSVDLGIASWQSDTAMAAIAAARTNLLNLGCTGTKVGLVGWSGGGGAGLVFAKQNPSQVAAMWLFSPVTDLDWIHQTAGYTPDYDTLGITPVGSWVAEVDTAYGGNYTANAAGHKIRDERRTWASICPITIAHSTDDPVLPWTASQALVAGAASPLVTLRTPATTGGHQGAILNVPATETVAFFRDRWAA